MANITLYLGTTVVNSTALDSRFGPTTAGGAFTNEQFTVPALTPGIYTLTVTDQYGASTGGVDTFTVNPTPATTIALRGASYYTGDTLSFTISTTETTSTPLGAMTVTIYDPSGVAQWTITGWNPVGTTTKIVPIMSQIDGNNNPITLPADAPTTGSWNWTITYTAVSLAPVVSKATGLFTVAPRPGIQDVLDKIDECCDTIEGVITTSEGRIIAAVNTKTGTIMTDLSALSPQLQGITDTVVIIATMLGEVQTDIAGLDMGTLGVDITAIKGDVATIKTSIGTVNTAVSNLGATVTSVQGDVATVQTTLGTLQGTVTAIDGKVATVNTSVGTLQADVTDVKGKADVTPVWIAVVLSLVAAIAAIFAVITIRQKIAG
jgi:hypothetical protein